MLDRVTQLEDEGILKRILQLLDEDKDWYDELTAEEKASLQKGIDQAERGEVISHEDFKKKHFKWH